MSNFAKLVESIKEDMLNENADFIKKFPIVSKEAAVTKTYAIIKGYVRGVKEIKSFLDNNLPPTNIYFSEEMPETAELEKLKQTLKTQSSNGRPILIFPTVETETANDMYEISIFKGSSGVFGIILLRIFKYIQPPKSIQFDANKYDISYIVLAWTKDISIKSKGQTGIEKSLPKED